MIATLILFLHLLGYIPADEAINFLYICGALLLIGEIFVTSMGMLAVNGAIALFIAYALQTGDHSVLGLTIDWSFLFGVAALEIILLVIAVMIYLHYRKKKVTTGTESMVGDSAEVIEWKDGKGRVTAQGEPWKAVGDEPLKKGDRVKILAVEGLVLKVTKS
ncbi:MAG: hypothetical protein LRY36_01330 [Alphaproteobacteria bacterium]|nr:hypothetical protein [Alphaproteobacteria bacterium]MCD8526288.1 hypothetical protein [Alphaproteobacteria bacterium]MCD8566559.1 hypothetical protein [Alphaproteobacteria bacterium]